MDENEAIGTDSAVTLVRQEEGVIRDKDKDDEEVKVRGGWDNKVQYILAQIGFAVGLGNVWRFPYLCQKNGGGAFLIPYFTMMVLEGIPLFYLEIAIGQRLKRGSVGVWNHIHPLLGGVGIASMVICFFIALYYNMIIAWALFYFFNSFQSVLPWSSCPTLPIEETPFESNETLELVVPECKFGETSYFWYRDSLNISPSINDPGTLEWRMVLCLLTAWIIVFAGMFNGIKSSGKVIYFSATFPYLVLLIFFVRGITLPGSGDGLAYMFTPDLTKLYDPNVWRDAATQIFFSLGLGFGGVIAYSSYNDVKNNCRRDALTVSLVNCGTSLFACLVVFSVLGFKAHTKSVICKNDNIDNARHFFNTNAPNSEYQHVLADITGDTYQEEFTKLNETMLSDPSLNETWAAMNFSICTIEEELKVAVSGPGLAFIAFTEAMIKMPGAPFWSIMFFSMLINLGLGSMFGTLEGILTPLKDLGFKVQKQLMVFILAVVCFLIGLIFCLNSGMYVLGLFDTYAGTLPLLLVAFFENIAVIYVYGFDKFSKDIEYMIGEKPGWYWKITWKYISPVCMLVLFVASLLNLFLKTPEYDAYDASTGEDKSVPYPAWAVTLLIMLILSSIMWIPIMALLRKFRCVRYLSSESASKQHPTHNGY